MKKIDTLCFYFVLGVLATFPVLGLYLLKSAMGLDLIEGPSFLHYLFW